MPIKMMMWKLSLQPNHVAAFLAYGGKILMSMQNCKHVFGNSICTSCVECDISLVHCAHLWDIMFNTQSKSGIYAHLCIILYLHYWQWISIYIWVQYKQTFCCVI